MGMSHAQGDATFAEYITIDGTSGDENGGSCFRKKTKINHDSTALKGCGKTIFTKPQCLSWEEAAGCGVVCYAAYDGLNASAAREKDRGCGLQKTRDC